MRHHGFTRPRVGPARAGLTALRATAAAAMLFGSLTVGLGAAGAQADEDEGTYESPTYGYTLAWDAEGWTVEQDAAQGDVSDATDAEFGRDFLQLNDVDGTTVLFVEGAEDEFDDVDACVETVLPELGIDPADGEAIEDEDGEPFASGDDTRARAGYILAVELDNGDTEDRVYGVECVADEDSDVIVAFSFISGIVDGYVENGYPLVEDIVGSLAFAGGSDEDATPESSSRGGGPDEDTPEASDDSGNGGGGSGTGGVDGNAYVSPTYGFALEWDEDVWEIGGESSEDGLDQLSLTSDTMIANVTGYGGESDPADCIDTYVGVIGDRSGSDAMIAEDPDSGDLFLFPSDDGTSVEAVIIYAVDGDGWASRVTCQEMEDGMLVVEFTGPGTVVVEDASSDLISDLLGSVRFP